MGIILHNVQTSEQSFFYFLIVGKYRFFQILQNSLNLGLSMEWKDAKTKGYWKNRKLERKTVPIKKRQNTKERRYTDVGWIQCDQIGWFIGYWAAFKSLCQQLFCPNLPHTFFVQVSKYFIFGQLYRFLATFYWSHCIQHTSV